VFSNLRFYDTAMAAHRQDFPVKSDDMVSYTEDGQYFTSGLFTSRPNLKSYIRRASQVTHAASKLLSAKLLQNLAQPTAASAE